MSRALLSVPLVLLLTGAAPRTQAQYRGLGDAAFFVHERFVGSGAYGVVHKFLDGVTGRPYAVKFPNFLGSIEAAAESLDRVERGIEANHVDFRSPRFRGIKLFENLYTHEQQRGLLTDWKDGETLDETLKRGLLKPDLAVELVRHLLDRADEFHQAGFLHLDAKPDNAMWEPEAGPESAVLIDHGSTNRAPLGYAGPEYSWGRGPFDARTDIFVLAGTLVALTTGQAPFSELANGQSQLSESELYDERAVLKRVRNLKLRAVLFKALSPDMGDRYQHVRELKEALGPFRPRR